MSRTKNRKGQRKQSAKRKQSIIISGIVAVIAGIFALLLVQSQASPGQTTVNIGERPAWQDVSLVNAKTRKSFVLNDYKDKHVVVKIMSLY